MAPNKRNWRDIPNKHLQHNVVFSSSYQSICEFCPEHWSFSSPSTHESLSITRPISPLCCLSFLLLAFASPLFNILPMRIFFLWPVVHSRNRSPCRLLLVWLNNWKFTYHSANFNLKQRQDSCFQGQLFKWKMRCHLDTENVNLFNVIGEIQREIVAKDLSFRHLKFWSLASFAKLGIAFFLHHCDLINFKT